MKCTKKSFYTFFGTVRPRETWLCLIFFKSEKQIFPNKIWAVCLDHWLLAFYALTSAVRKLCKEIVLQNGRFSYSQQVEKSGKSKNHSLNKQERKIPTLQTFFFSTFPSNKKETRVKNPSILLAIKKNLARCILCLNSEVSSSRSKTKMSAINFRRNLNYKRKDEISLCRLFVLWFVNSGCSNYKTSRKVCSKWSSGHVKCSFDKTSQKNLG